jgi:hypothetical protein
MMTPMFYMAYAVETKAAMQRFIVSVNSMMHRHTNSTGPSPMSC